MTYEEAFEYLESPCNHCEAGCERGEECLQYKAFKMAEKAMSEYGRLKSLIDEIKSECQHNLEANRVMYEKKMDKLHTQVDGDIGYDLGYLNGQYRWDVDILEKIEMQEKNT